jgi:hypothetical protein
MARQKKTEKIDLNFIEEPLGYNDALLEVQKFEREYKVASAELFAALAAGKECLYFHSDDIYEWRSYYEFLCGIDAKLGKLLESNAELGEDDLAYSGASGSTRISKVAGSKRKQDLSLAA